MISKLYSVTQLRRIWSVACLLQHIAQDMGGMVCAAAQEQTACCLSFVGLNFATASIHAYASEQLSLMWNIPLTDSSVTETVSFNNKQQQN